MRMIFGIDPGVRGGIALMVDDVRAAHICAWQMPTMKSTTSTGRTRTSSDLKALRQMLGAPIIQARTQGMKPNVVVYLESQQAMARSVGGVSVPQGMVQCFSLGREFGRVEALVVGLGIALKYVHPKRWQNVILGQIAHGTSKEQSIIVARNLFPHVSLKPTKACGKDSDGIADALLIAEYGRRELGTTGIE